MAVHRCPSVIDEGADSVLVLALALVAVLVMVMLVAVVLVLFMAVLIVIVLIIVVIVMMVVVVMFVMLVVLFVVMVVVIVLVVSELALFQGLAPACCAVDGVEIERSGGQDVLDGDVAVAGLDDVYTRMEGLDDLADLGQVGFGDEVDLVDDQRGAELDLLDQEALDVLFLNLVLLQEVLSAGELVHESCGVHDSDYVVQRAVLNQLQLLGYGHGLADSGGLDEDVVVFAGLDHLLDVAGHLALEGAADAAVCQRDDVACVCYVSALCDQGGVHVHFADVIDDDCDPVTLLVVQDPVQQCGLACSEIAAKQRDGCLLFLNYSHDCSPCFML